MALLSLHTEKGSATVNASNDVGLSIVTADGSELKPSIIKGEAALSTGNVRISPTVGTYVVTPEAAISITFDATDIGNSNAQFSLILDMTDGVQAVSFPDNFKWNGDSPDISAKGTYAIDVMRISVGEVSGYIGNLAGCVKPDPAVSIYCDGVLYSSGDYYYEISQYSLPGNDTNEIIIREGATVGSISYDTTLFDGPMGTPTKVSIYGGFVAVIDNSSGAEPSSHSNHCVEIYDGYVEYIYMMPTNITHPFVSLYGGTVANIYASSWAVTPVLSISGGRCLELEVDSSGAVVSMSSGQLDRITILGGVYDPASFYITGGTVGYFDASREDAEHSVSLVTSGCTIEHMCIYMGTYGVSSLDEGSGFGDNVVVNRLEFTGCQEPSTHYTLPVGANSIIKLAASAQQLVAGGYLVIDADPTAQIINL